MVNEQLREIPKKSIKDMHDILLKEQFKLPDNYEAKILKLEEELHSESITSENLKELIHLYTVIICYSIK